MTEEETRQKVAAAQILGLEIINKPIKRNGKYYQQITFKNGGGRVIGDAIELELDYGVQLANFDATIANAEKRIEELRAAKAELEALT